MDHDADATITSWIADDPDGAPVAVFATTAPAIKRSVDVDAIEDLMALAYEGDGFFYVAADDATTVVHGDDDVAVLRRQSSVVLSWTTTAAWRAVAQARQMAVWIVAEVDAAQWQHRPIAEVLADAREGVFIVAVVGPQAEA